MADLKYEPWEVFYSFHLSRHEVSVSAKSEMQAVERARSLAFDLAETILFDQFPDWREVIEYDIRLTDNENYEAYVDYIDAHIKYGVAQ